MNLRIHAQEFLASKAASGRSPNTVYSYQYSFDGFCNWCEENGFTDNDLVGSIGAETIEEHLLALSNQGFAPHTIAQRFRSLRALYRWIEQRYGRTEQRNPFDMLSEPSTPNLLPKAVTYAQLQVLLHSIKGDQWMQHRDRLLIKMFFYTGLRLGEMATVTINDLDLERRRLRVFRWKTKQEEFVPFSLSLQEELKIWLDVQRPACDHNGLWPAYGGGKDSVSSEPLQPQGIRQMMRYRCKRAGLPKFLPHALRHGCAVHVIERGGDISLVQRLLGHQDISTSSIYLRFNTDQVKKMYDRVFD